MSNLSSMASRLVFVFFAPFYFALLFLSVSVYSVVTLELDSVIVLFLFCHFFLFSSSPFQDPLFSSLFYYSALLITIILLHICVEKIHSIC